MNIWHMSGAGNDFVVLDARGKELDFSTLAKKLCDKYGTDGLMALDHSEVADFRLHFYNSDGSRGEMCGNGARCICKFAYDNGVVGQEMTAQTDAGIVYGWRLNDEHYRMRLNLPSVVDLQRTENAAYVELGQPGIPHSITRVEGLCHDQKENLLPLAKELRFHKAFPKGVNVNFYDWVDKDRVRILTYERWVEDYTLACGTGSASVAVVLYELGQLPGGVLKMENPGGILTVTLKGEEGKVTELYLEGPVVILKKDLL